MKYLSLCVVSTSRDFNAVHSFDKGCSMKRSLVILTIVITFTAPVVLQADTDPPLPGGSYNDAIPTLQSVLGFDHGDRPIRHHEAVTYLKKLAQVSPRATYVEAGYTHEKRLLGYLLVSSEKNMQQLDGIKSGMNRLADLNHVPKNIKSTVATAWMMYSIHGDE